MNVGTEFRVSLGDITTPLIGRLVEVPVEGEPANVLARILSVDENGAMLKAVSLTTRE